MGKQIDTGSDLPWERKQKQAAMRSSASTEDEAV